jgi:DDE domain
MAPSCRSRCGPWNAQRSPAGSGSQNACRRCQSKFAAWEKRSVASGDAQSLPLLQQLARGDPPHGDDVRPLSAVAAAGRRSAIRAGDRYQPRNGAVLVEPVRSDVFAAAIRKRRVQNQSYSRWRWHLDEVFVRINGETHYLWRAVDHEGEVLEVFATQRRDRRAALGIVRLIRSGSCCSVST